MGESRLTEMLTESWALGQPAVQGLAGQLGLADCSTCNPSHQPLVSPQSPFAGGLLVQPAVSSLWLLLVSVNVHMT